MQGIVRGRPTRRRLHPAAPGTNALTPASNASMRTRPAVLACAVAVAVTALATGLGATPSGATPSVAASPPHPHLTVTPSHAMAGRRLVVSGWGFPAGTRVTLAECGAKVWIAPKDPCAHGSVTVKTDGHGRLHTRMTARLCPQTSRAKRTEDTCYVGQPMGRDVDVIVLQGAARVVVSQP